MTLEIRDAGVDDRRKIQRVARITWDHTYSETLPESVGKEFVSQAYSADSLRHRMEANVFLVAATGEEILGFADFHRLSETAVELAAIYVLPEMQGRGSGLASSAPESAELPTPYGLTLRVEQDNTRARCFYEAHGFRHTGEYAEEFYGHIIHKLEMILRPQIPLLEPSPPRVESGDSNNQVTVQ